MRSIRFTPTAFWFTYLSLDLNFLNDWWNRINEIRFLIYFIHFEFDAIAEPLEKIAIKEKFNFSLKWNIPLNISLTH